MIRHFKIWNRWRKHNTNSKLHKILVLLKLKISPTMALMYHYEKLWEEINNGN